MPTFSRPADPALGSADPIRPHARPARWRGWVPHAVLIAALLLFKVALLAALVLLAR